MAVVQYIETTSAKLKSLPLVDGRFTFVTDTGAFYRDTASERFLLSGGSDIMVFANESTLCIETSGNRVNIFVGPGGDNLNFNSLF